MKSLVTTLGRSHFVQATDALRRAGINAELAQGWLPKNIDDSCLLAIFAMILGRKKSSFLYGFKHRSTECLRGHNFSDFWAEAVQSALVLVSRFFKSRSLCHWGMKVGFWLHGKHVAKIIAVGDYQILHVRSGFGRFAIASARRKGVKVLVDHSAGAPQYIVEEVEGKTWDSKSYWWTVMQDCEDADLLMVNSDFAKSTLIKYGYPESRIRVVYLGLDEKFNGMKRWEDVEVKNIGHDEKNPIRLIFTGTFAPHKGSTEFLQAVSILLRSGLHFNVTVLGSVALTDEQRVLYPDAIKKIEFKGHLPQDEMCREMQCHQIYVFPSYSEGCARSAAEAMSMGLCVVCTKETGVPLTDGYDGFLIEKRNAQTIADAIDWLCKHPREIRRAGEAASNTMRRYSWDYYAANVKNIYAELLEREI